MLKLSADRLRVLEREQQAAHHVVDVAPGADLRAVAVDRQVAPGERRLDERADRAAADLPGAVDVERAHGDGRQAELVVVGVRHVLAGELRDRVGPARLADRADRRHVALGDVERVLAEHLARRELDQPLERVVRRERGLERVVGADQVDAHRPHRAREHGVDAGDRGAVDEVRRAARELLDQLRVEDVALRNVKVRVLGRGRCRRARRGAGCRRRRRSLSSTRRRASVVPMNPAPPVIRIRFPSEPRGESRCALGRSSPGDRARRPLPASARRRRAAACSGGDRAAQAWRSTSEIAVGPRAGPPPACSTSPPLRPARRHRSPATAACRRLLARPPWPFAPTPATSRAGRSTAGRRTRLVTGTLRGAEACGRDLRRRDGCEIARWNRVAFLLG